VTYRSAESNPFITSEYTVDNPENPKPTNPDYTRSTREKRKQGNNKRTSE
jgi:hypothetical protein